MESCFNENLRDVYLGKRQTMHDKERDYKMNKTQLTHFTLKLLIVVTLYWGQLTWVSSWRSVRAFKAEDVIGVWRWKAGRVSRTRWMAAAKDTGNVSWGLLSWMDISDRWCKLPVNNVDITWAYPPGIEVKCGGMLWKLTTLQTSYSEYLCFFITLKTK